MYKIYVLGLGPGHQDYILPKTKKIIQHCSLIVGGSRQLESVDTKGKSTFVTDQKLTTLPKLLSNEVLKQDIAVIVSGDTGFYSLTKYILKHVDNNLVEVIPGISSMQYMFSKVKLSWDDAFISSLHGRENGYLAELQRYKKVGLLTDKTTHTPQVIAKQLIKNGYRQATMYVGENLSYESERITKGTPTIIAEMPAFDLSVVVIKID